uniref:hypothetical protein n=1 Tax=Nonomuraea sp. CA-252377 TaxID=3240003 RepID=UPI003F498AA3
MTAHPLHALVPALTPAPAHAGELSALTFSQGRAAARLYTDVDQAAARAREFLWSYTCTPGGELDHDDPTPHIVVRLARDLDADRLSTLTCHAELEEVGPQLTGARFTGPDQSTYWWIADPPALVCASGDRRRVSAHCLTAASATYWGYRLVRQAITGRLLAGGAVFAHAAAVQIAGRTVMICGPTGSGKTTVLLTALRHLAGHFITNDRLLLLPDAGEGGLIGYPWPDHIRAGLGTLRAFPELTALGADLAPDLTRVPPLLDTHKVTIRPRQFPHLLAGGRMQPACRPTCVIWPRLSPGEPPGCPEPLAPGDVAATLEATRLFMREVGGRILSHINQWLYPEPAPAAGRQHLRAATAALAGLADEGRCLRLRTDGDPRRLADQLARLLADLP